MNGFVRKLTLLSAGVVLSSPYQWLSAVWASTDSSSPPISHLEPEAAPNQVGGSDQAQLANSANPSQGSSGEANTIELPTQILRTGINLRTPALSANSRQLADFMELTPLLVRIQEGRNKLAPGNRVTADNMLASQQLCLDTVEATQLIQEANLSVDFALAEINAEQNVYSTILSTYTSDRDKAVFKTNALSFMTNGALWAIGEALDVPTNTHPNYSVSSGIFGILAGIIPSIASFYALYQVNGKKKTSEVEPNMLSKVFDYPTDIDIDYPPVVWSFLNSVPPGDRSGKTRKVQLVDRWIADKNISGFTDRTSRKQLDVITGSVSQKKGLSISTLTIRQTMLSQLGAEIMKMKRMLLELTMTVHGEKRI
jgi:hypothetical protein